MPSGRIDAGSFGLRHDRISATATALGGQFNLGNGGDVSEVVMFFDRRPLRNETQIPRHAQMQDQTTLHHTLACTIQQQVLAASAHAGNHAAGKQGRQLRRHRQTQTRHPDHHIDNFPAQQLWRYPLAANLDLWQFRHRLSLRAFPNNIANLPDISGSNTHLIRKPLPCNSSPLPPQLSWPSPSARQPTPRRQCAKAMRTL